MWMHAFAHRGCMDTARESALKVDFVRKIPRRTGESNLRQRRATLCQLSYIPIPMILYQDWKYEKAGISICASAWAKPQRSSQATLSCSFLLSYREGTLLKVPKLIDISNLSKERGRKEVLLKTNSRVTWMLFHQPCMVMNRMVVQMDKSFVLITEATTAMCVSEWSWRNRANRRPSYGQGYINRSSVISDVSLHWIQNGTPSKIKQAHHSHCSFHRNIRVSLNWTDLISSGQTSTMCPLVSTRMRWTLIPFFKFLSQCRWRTGLPCHFKLYLHHVCFKPSVRT